MGLYRGYYSLMQFYPSTSRAEAANLGVILFCPECDFLEARVSEGNDRASRFFVRSSFSAQRLNDAKRAIVTRLQVERQFFRTIDDLIRFVDTRANDITLTPPRPVSVDNPVDNLNALYSDLVGGRQVVSPRSRATIGQQLKQIFERPGISEKVIRNARVIVPITNEEFTAPYAFQNGVLNLVSPLKITIGTIAEAHKLAIDGDLLRKHAGEMAEPAELLVAIARPETPELIQNRTRAESLLREYNVRTYREEQIDDLRRYVESAINH